jgi:hypothetical protein
VTNALVSRVPLEHQWLINSQETKSIKKSRHIRKKLPSSITPLHQSAHPSTPTGKFSFQSSSISKKKRKEL